MRRVASAAIAAAIVVASLLVLTPFASKSAATVRQPGALPQLSQMNQLVMVTPSVGYALLETYGATCGIWVAGTTNGGATFHSPEHVQRVDCNDQNTGSEAIAVDTFGDIFVYGNGLFVSQDGGGSWSRIPMNGNVLQVVSQGGREWLVETACGLGTRGPCPLRVAVSSNGGKTWSFTASRPTGATSSPGVEDRTYMLIASDDTVYVFSQPPVINGSTRDQATWVSPDGGSSWHVRGVPCRGPVGTDAAIAPSGAVWSVCGGEPGAGQQGKTVDVSYNEGQTWRATGACSGTGRHEDGALCSGYAQSVVALSGDNAFLAADRGCLMVTRDGGWRWTCSGGISNGAGYLVQVMFVNLDDGIATGGYGTGFRIYHTSNGGRSWTAVKPHWS
jgi:hypothetical protein